MKHTIPQHELKAFWNWHESERPTYAQVVVKLANKESLMRLLCASIQATNIAFAGCSIGVSSVEIDVFTTVLGKDSSDELRQKAMCLSYDIRTLFFAEEK